MLEVVAAFIRDGEKFLICQRPAGKNCAFGWEFPGGKLEAGETKPQALARECREELNVELDVARELADVTHAYPGFSIHLTLLECEIRAGSLTALEHNALQWITAAEIPNYEFCPADQKLIQKLRLLWSWQEEQAIAHIHGWDFSHLNGRYAEEDDLPWDYRALIDKYRKPEMRILDIDTGGGEFLLSLNHPHANTAATEAFPPNIRVCEDALLPLGIDFRPGSAGQLPFGDGAFDLVINRHGDFDPVELRRVLKPGGIFITQQVGAENDRELAELLLPGVRPPFPEQYLSIAEREFRAAGFEILESAEVFRPIEFYDTAALVWFARIIQWEFSGFSVEKCLPQLWQAQSILEEKGRISGRIHRFMLVGRRV
ncbi:MAG: NUDIX domain-containing protein [Clostridia bacterium]|nr:NUDIX domain-containing protein [Clostridia bacterium]